jgi:hypothetical protein
MKDRKQYILIRTLSKQIVKVPEKLSVYEKIRLRRSFGKWKNINQYYDIIIENVKQFSVIDKKTRRY